MGKLLRDLKPSDPNSVYSNESKENSPEHKKEANGENESNEGLPNSIIKSNAFVLIHFIS
jgi:hypothetical protein